MLCVHCGESGDEVVSESLGSQYREEAGAPPDSSTASTADPGDEIDLGEVDCSEWPAGSEASFTLPRGVAGFQIVAQASSARYPTITSLRDPSGTPIVELVGGDRFFATTKKKLGDTDSSTTDMLAVPQHGQPEALSPAPGKWTFRVRSYDPKIHVRVLLRRTPDGLPAPGVLDVAIYIPEGLTLDGESVTAANAAESVPLKRRLDAYDAKLEAFWGLRLGKLRFSSIDARFRKFESIEEAYDVGKETKIPGRVVHLVLSEESDEFLGLSSGIPAVAATPGTTMSHIVLASAWRKKTTDEYAANADKEGGVLAHETGHYLGLFHTSELNGKDFDALDDTPQCSPETIAADKKACPDYVNVMFGGGSPTATMTSPLQRRIVQSSPLVRDR